MAPESGYVPPPPEHPVPGLPQPAKGEKPDKKPPKGDKGIELPDPPGAHGQLYC